MHVYILIFCVLCVRCRLWAQKKIKCEGGVLKHQASLSAGSAVPELVRSGDSSTVTDPDAPWGGGWCPCPAKNKDYEDFWRKRTLGAGGVDVGSGDGRMAILFALLHHQDTEWWAVEVRKEAHQDAVSLLEIVRRVVPLPNVHLVHADARTWVPPRAHLERSAYTLFCNNVVFHTHANLMEKVVQNWLLSYPVSKIITLATVYPEAVYSRRPMGPPRPAAQRRGAIRERFHITYTGKEAVKFHTTWTNGTPHQGMTVFQYEMLKHKCRLDKAAPDIIFGHTVLSSTQVRRLARGPHTRPAWLSRAVRVAKLAGAMEEIKELLPIAQLESSPALPCEPAPSIAAAINVQLCSLQPAEQTKRKHLELVLRRSMSAEGSTKDPINGELTEASYHSILAALFRGKLQHEAITLCDFGSGRAKVCWYAAQTYKVHAIGIESSEIRHSIALGIQEQLKKENVALAERVQLRHGCIMGLPSRWHKFNVAYSFCVGMPANVLTSIIHRCHAQRGEPVRVALAYSKQQLLAKIGVRADVVAMLCLRETVSTKMHGSRSCGHHMFSIYTVQSAPFNEQLEQDRVTQERDAEQTATLAALERFAIEKKQQSQRQHEQEQEQKKELARMEYAALRAEQKQAKRDGQLVQMRNLLPGLGDPNAITALEATAQKAKWCHRRALDWLELNIGTLTGSGANTTAQQLTAAQHTATQQFHFSLRNKAQLPEDEFGKIWERSMLLVQVNLPAHWVLVEIDITEKVITILDSFKWTGAEDNHKVVFETLQDFMQHEWVATHAVGSDVPRLEERTVWLPQQPTNANTCGVHMILNTSMRMGARPLESYDNSEINRQRRLMAREAIEFRTRKAAEQVRLLRARHVARLFDIRQCSEYTAGVFE